MHVTYVCTYTRSVYSRFLLINFWPIHLFPLFSLLSSAFWRFTNFLVNSVLGTDPLFKIQFAHLGFLSNELGLFIFIVISRWPRSFPLVSLLLLLPSLLRIDCIDFIPSASPDAMLGVLALLSICFGCYPRNLYFVHPSKYSRGHTLAPLSRRVSEHCTSQNPLLYFGLFGPFQQFLNAVCF